MRVKRGHCICLPQAWEGWWKAQALESENRVHAVAVSPTGQVILRKPLPVNEPPSYCPKWANNNNTFVAPCC